MGRYRRPSYITTCWWRHRGLTQSWRTRRRPEPVHRPSISRTRRPELGVHQQWLSTGLQGRREWAPGWRPSWRKLLLPTKRLRRSQRSWRRSDVWRRKWRTVFRFNARSVSIRPTGCGNPGSSSWQLLPFTKGLYSGLGYRFAGSKPGYSTVDYWRDVTRNLPLVTVEWRYYILYVTHTMYLYFYDNVSCRNWRFF